MPAVAGWGTMVVHMASAGHATKVVEALRLSGALGVVSVYVNARAAATPGNADMHGLEVELARVGRTVDAAWAADGEPAHAALASIKEHVRDAVLSGEARNLALFGALGHGETVVFEPAGSVPTRAVLGPRADVRPLCVALQESRPAGVALVSVERIRVLEWTPGALADVWSETFPELEQRDLRGPAHAHPHGLPGAAPGSKSGQQRDLFASRARDALERLLAVAGQRIAKLATERDWPELALAGDNRLVSMLARGLPAAASVDLVPLPRLEQWRSPGELAGLVAPAIADARDRRTTRLVGRVLESAGGSCARGLGETLAALADKRVDTLLMPADRPIAGRSGAKGLLAAPGDVPAGHTAAELVDDPMLADAMIAEALSARAAVVVLSGVCARMLDDDVAALLRY